MWYHEPRPGTLSTIKGTYNSQMPLGVCKDELEVTYINGQPDLRAAFKRRDYHAKSLYDVIRMKFVHAMAWFRGSCTTLVEFNAFHGKSLGQMWLLALE